MMKSMEKVFRRAQRKPVKIVLRRISAKSDEMLSFLESHRGAIYTFWEIWL